MKNLFVTTAFCIAPFTAALAQTCSKQSPAHTVALLELYTSEGCSSCPPADRFVSGLRGGSGSDFSGLTADQVVPLSLHVDYWDYIGWKDRFANRAFTERQRWLTESAGSRTVYTPEVFMSGRELRDWRGSVSATARHINQRPAQANIHITLGKLTRAGLPVEVSADAAQGGKLFVALYENGVVSEVRAGENRGATLRHDYVVREWLGPLALSGDAGGDKAALSRVVAVPSGAAAKNLGVAAFVQSDGGEVLQALSLALCGS